MDIVRVRGIRSFGWSVYRWNELEIGRGGYVGEGCAIVGKNPSRFGMAYPNNNNYQVGPRLCRYEYH